MEITVNSCYMTRNFKIFYYFRDPPKEFHCDICNKILYRWDNYRTHIEKHAKLNDCNICKKPFNKEADLNNHQLYSHSSLTGGGEVEEEFSPIFDVREISKRTNKKFNTNYQFYEAKLKNKNSFTPSPDNVATLITSLLEDITPDIADRDSIGLSLQSPSLDYPVSLPQTRKEDLTPAKIFQHIESVLNSNDDFRIDQELKMNVTHVRIPEGRGGNGRPHTTFKNMEDAFKNKRSVIQIR